MPRKPTTTATTAPTTEIETDPATTAPAAPEAGTAPEDGAAPEAAPAPVKLTDAQVYAAAVAGAPTLKALLERTGCKAKAQLLGALFRHCEATGEPLPSMPGTKGGGRAGDSTLAVSIRGLAIGRGKLKAIGIELPEPDASGSWPTGVQKVRVRVQVRDDVPGVGKAIVILTVPTE